jgi:FtsP/CotA-like multicopper oxidase with cupredoxin domain
MPVISSGAATATSWSTTLEVREHHHVNHRVGFTTRSYCHQGVCSYPGPTLSLKPGDNLTLTLINRLGPDPSPLPAHVHNTIHSPNTTNLHTHGLHISPLVDNVFLSAGPGEALVYAYEIRPDHAPGLHWFHAHHHGSSTLQLMGGLVGALVIESVRGGAANVSDSLLLADTRLLVLTRLLFKQETENGRVTQGCGPDQACDPTSQAPLCYGHRLPPSISSELC